jgi:hypothetical protein
MLGVDKLLTLEYEVSYSSLPIRLGSQFAYSAMEERSSGARSDINAMFVRTELSKSA